MMTRMISRSGRLKWVLAAVLLLAAAWLWDPVKDLAYSVRLALVLQRQASGATGEGLAVREIKVRRPWGSENREALVYYPRGSSPRKAVIIVAGLSELGCYHPSLVAFSRQLAHTGVYVITPDIREFRAFRISAEPMEEVVFWFNQIGALEGSRRVEKTGLAGISFSATLVLIAAARSDLRDRVSFVLGIGPYCDLSRCAGEWFAAGPGTAADGRYPTRFYAKWIIMLAALEMVPHPGDRRSLHSVLEALLLQREIPSPEPGLTDEGKRWYRLATMRGDRSDDELVRRIEERLAAKLYHELDPVKSLPDLRCPAFFLHGAYDDLIPPRESLDLHQRIPRSFVLISPFLTHTHPSDRKLPLRRRVTAGLEALMFCYRLARVIH